jgi:hypothetical protein
MVISICDMPGITNQLASLRLKVLFAIRGNICWSRVKPDPLAEIATTGSLRWRPHLEPEGLRIAGKPLGEQFNISVSLREE